MRTLRFIVNGQTIKQDPNCDFTGLVPGSEGYLRAEFIFDKEWANTTKVVGFYSNMGKEYDPQSLVDKNFCMIPKEATKNRIFKIRVIGKKNSFTLSTNKLSIDQKGG